MANSVWQQCFSRLEEEVPPEQFNTWIRPLQARQHEGRLELLAPNRYVRDQVESLFLVRISQLMDQLGDASSPLGLTLDIGSSGREAPPLRAETTRRGSVDLNRVFTFETFVEGKSNEIAKAAAQQVSENA